MCGEYVCFAVEKQLFFKLFVAALPRATQRACYQAYIVYAISCTRNSLKNARYLRHTAPVYDTVRQGRPPYWGPAPKAEDNEV
jgi:hypothetical protein